jgi:hypothetical protein
MIAVNWLCATLRQSFMQEQHVEYKLVTKSQRLRPHCSYEACVTTGAAAVSSASYGIIDVPKHSDDSMLGSEHAVVVAVVYRHFRRHDCSVHECLWYQRDVL